MNKFPGTCGCGADVPAGAGTVAKKGGRWVVRCAECSPTAAAPARRKGRTTGFFEPPAGVEWDSCLDTPSGHSIPCSAKYAELHDELLDIEASLHEMPDADCSFEGTKLYLRRDAVTIELHDLAGKGHLADMEMASGPDPVVAAFVSLLRPSL